MDIKTWTPIYSKFPINKDEFNLNPGFHPLVIFKTRDGYFYLACTSKIDKQKEFHVYVPKSIPKDKTKDYLFNRPSLIDTRRIFYMNKKDFEKCFETNYMKNPSYYNSPEISDKYKIRILESIQNNLRKNNFSVIYSKIEDNNYINSDLVCVGKESISLLVNSFKNKKTSKFNNLTEFKEYLNTVSYNKSSSYNKKNIQKIYDFVFAKVSSEKNRIQIKYQKNQSENLDYSQ